MPNTLENALVAVRDALTASGLDWKEARLSLALTGCGDPLVLATLQPGAPQEVVASDPDPAPASPAADATPAATDDSASSASATDVTPTATDATPPEAPKPDDVPASEPVAATN